AEEQARKQAAIEAIEQAKRDAEEAKQAREAEEQARKQAAIEAKEQAKRDAEEAKEKARQEAEEANQQDIEGAKKALEAEIAAREKAEQKAEETVEDISSELYRREVEPLLSLPIDLEQVRHLEEYLEEVEGTRDALIAGKIGSEEAIQRLRDISERLSKEA
ncbi:hypothetical protein ACFLU1_06930, partial [Chloroflexota bacterium]